jgi:uncharacterized surface protein with fasciclin (FAS1) repeats
MNTKIKDIEFSNGIIHIIDKLLLIPLSLSATLLAGNFTALAGAATSANLIEPLESLSDVTIFCPNNDAFQKRAGANVTDDQLAQILQYHVVQGAPVGYSTTLSNDMKLPTLAGEELTITIDEEGAVFVNDARVINSDILIANGVLHVIDTVLNPAEADAEPSTEEEEEEPSATLGSVVPFTSGIEPETSVYSELTQTTSFVAAGLITGTPSSSTAARGNGSAASTTSAGPVQQTGNAGVRRELPALAVAIVGAVAFAVHM